MTKSPFVYSILDDGITWTYLEGYDLANMKIAIYYADVDSFECRMELHFKNKIKEGLTETNRTYYMKNYVGTYKTVEKLKEGASKRKQKTTR